MSIKDFELLISEIKLEVWEGNVNMVLENIIKVSEVVRNTNKSGFELLKSFIRSQKI